MANVNEEIAELKNELAVMQVKYKELTARCEKALEAIEGTSAIFAEHVATLDSRMDELGAIYISKLEGRLPRMGR